MQTLLQSCQGYRLLRVPVRACVQTLLESHQGWYHLQRCKDRFEGLLKIDKLKRNAGRAVPMAAASQRASAIATAAPSGELHKAAHVLGFATCIQRC